MRILVLVVGLLFVTTSAWAKKPKVAVAPFKGDKGNKVADAIADSLAGSVKVVDPKATGKAVDKLGAGKELDNDEATKLAKKLEVDAVVQGKLDNDGDKKTLKVAIFLKGKDDAVRFTVQFKTVNDKFREDVSKLIVKKLGTIEDDAKPEPEDKPKRIVDPDEDPDEPKIKKKKKKKKADEDEPSDGPKKVAARFDVGGFGGVRTLTYSATTPPPRVGTRNTAVLLAGEVYPLAFGGKTGGAAGLGIAGEFQKTLGLSIKLAGGSVPINQGLFSIGGRYRIVTSAVDLILGLDFKKQKYVADRSGLAMPTDLDMSDVNYTMVVPNVGIAKGATDKVTIFGRGGAMLVLNTGPIQEREQYGAATVIGFDIKAGADIAFTERIGLRLAGGFSNIVFKFKGNGAMAAARGVAGAADRDFGVAATLGVTY